MGSPPGDHAGANAGAARAMQLKVLMPSSSRKMRISDELAAHLLGGARSGRAGGAAATARVRQGLGRRGRPGRRRRQRVPGARVAGVRRGTRPRRRMVRRAPPRGRRRGHRQGARHHQLPQGVRHSPPAVVATRRGRARDASHKLQFVRVLLPGFMEKMRIPDKFVQHHITEEHLNSNMANILSPLGKFWRIELEKDDSGMFFKGGWLQFLSFHGISPGDVVLLRHEGNLAFKIKVFGPNGCKKDFKTKDIRIQQNTGNQHEAPSFSWMKCNQKNRRCGEHNENQHCSRKVNSKKMSGRVTKRQKRTESIYGIGPSSWIKKMISKYMLERAFLSLSGIFCKSIGLVDESTITLETSRGSSRRSWEVPAHVKKNGHGGCYLVGAGWKRFCHDNGLKVGDVCTFNVVEANLWHVFIERS